MKKTKSPKKKSPSKILLTKMNCKIDVSSYVSKILKRRLAYIDFTHIIEIYLKKV